MHGQRGGSTSTWARWALALALVMTTAGWGTRALAGPDPREIQARQDFVEGRYQQALDLFARLYAETLHPNYLRNIGRCYQNLKQPDRAISSFRDYLHKAKEISPAERQEIEGYIKEMEDLKAEREREAKAPPAPEAPPPPVTPLPSSPQPEPANAPVVVSAAPAEAPPAETPVYARWWFWALIGGAVAAGIGVAAATGAFTKTEDASCPMGISCR